MHGKHDGEVTDLSIYHWGMTYLPLVSTDGMVCKLVFIFIKRCLFWIKGSLMVSFFFLSLDLVVQYKHVIFISQHEGLMH